MATLAQLYPRRNSSSWTDALNQIATAGFDGVEGCSLNFGDPEAFRGELDRWGLIMPQSHVSLDTLERDFSRAVGLSKKLGIHTLISLCLPEEQRPVTSEDWRTLGLRLNSVEGKLRANGLRFAWHNHDFELVRLPDGTIPIEILLNMAPGMDWEVDLGWILRTGQDPVTRLKSYAGRIIAVHLKDLQPDVENEPKGSCADVGHGTTDWLPIFKTLSSMPRLAAHVAEHDELADSQRFLSRWKIAHDRLMSIRSGRAFEGFTHVALKVCDIGKLLDFYERLMGFPEMFRLNNEDGSLFLVYLRLNDRQYLELFPEATGSDTPTPNARGYQHICLEVADLDETVGQLLARGARMCVWRTDLCGLDEVEGSAITLGRDGNRQSWLMDPEGNRIELMEMSPSCMQYQAISSLLESGKR